MAIRILPAVGDPAASQALTGLLGRLPGAEPLPPVPDSTRLLETLDRLAAASVADLPEVVLVHELLGPVPALDVIRDVALRFPAVGVVLVTRDTGPALYSAAMDAGARGVAGLPLSYDDLAHRVGAAATWAAGMRRHLGGAPSGGTGDDAGHGGGLLLTVSGAKGGVGCTLTAVHLALAARAAGRDTALVDLNLQSGDVASFLDVQFRRSVVDLAGIDDLSPRVLEDAVYVHETGVGLLLAPGEGERGEEVDDRAARQILRALRARYEVVVVDCGTQMHAANAAAVETADRALLLTTPDVISVRAAKRMIRLWDRLRIRTPEGPEKTVTVVNRASRHTEIQPALVARVTGTPVARTTVPAGFKELHGALDAGRLQDLDQRSSVKQALWALAAELGATAPAPAAGPPPAGPEPGAAPPPHLGSNGSAPAALPPAPAYAPQHTDRGPAPFWRRKAMDDRGALTVEFAGMAPLVLVVLALLWQCVLIGYTFTLAGNAADEAARAATAAAAYGDPQSACATAAHRHLPDAWDSGAHVSCHLDGQVWKAQVDLPAPVLFPGAAHLPFTVHGGAGAAEEG
jgi:pilus assembly protein CpaE